MRLSTFSALRRDREQLHQRVTLLSLNSSKQENS
jgi:hypothetical protein